MTTSCIYFRHYMSEFWCLNGLTSCIYFSKFNVGILVPKCSYIFYLFPTFNVGILMPKCSSCFHFRHLISEIWLIHILCSKECFKNLPTEPRKLEVMWVRFLNAFFDAKYEICCSWRGTRTKWWRSWGSSAGLSRQGIEKHEPAGLTMSQK